MKYKPKVRVRVRDMSLRASRPPVEFRTAVRRSTLLLHVSAVCQSPDSFIHFSLDLN